MKSPILFVGIDVSKHKHDVAIVDENKRIIQKPFVIHENHAGYQNLIQTLNQKQNQCQAQTIAIGMEATGNYWKNLFNFLNKHDNGYHTVLINPIQTRAHAKSQLRRATTDPIAATDIAKFMAERKPKASCPINPAYELIKDLDQHRLALVKQRTANVNRLRNELAKVAPEIEKHIQKITGLQILALLKHYPTAQAICHAGPQTLQKITYGKRQWKLPMPFIRKMKNLAENSIAYKTGPHDGYIVSALISTINHIQKQIQTTQNLIHTIFEQNLNKKSLLESINGISANNARILEAYIGDVNRFHNAKKIVAYFGLNPTINQSGTSKNKKARLQKKGNHSVRQKLFMITLNLIRHKQEPFYAFYLKLTKKGKPKLVAIAATMRKLLVIIYYLLKTKQPFMENKHQQTIES